jgi:hypothetical protein
LVPDFQIEHVWPNNPSKLNLNAEEKIIHEQYKDKLGNLTIALRQWNESWGNKPFDKKKKKYSDSMLKIQNILAKNDDLYNRLLPFGSHYNCLFSLLALLVLHFYENTI